MDICGVLDFMRSRLLHWTIVQVAQVALDSGVQEVPEGSCCWEKPLAAHCRPQWSRPRKEREGQETCSLIPQSPPITPPWPITPLSITHLNCIAPPCTNSILVQELIGQLLVWLENLMWAGMQVGLTFLTSEIFTKVLENSALCLAPHKVVGSTYQDLEMVRQVRQVNDACRIMLPALPHQAAIIISMIFRCSSTIMQILLGSNRVAHLQIEIDHSSGRQWN